MKVGRFLLVNEGHLDLTHRWFARWGSVTVFVCRFVPVVRHLVSVPAGIARMNRLKFCVYTTVGATLWNSLLLWAGWHLEDKWETQVMPYRRPIDAVIVVALVVTAAAWVWMHWKNRNGKLAEKRPVESHT